MDGFFIGKNSIIYFGLLVLTHLKNRVVEADQFLFKLKMVNGYYYFYNHNILFNLGFYFMKFILKKIPSAFGLATLLLCASLISNANAQTIPISENLFGVNYWYYDFANGTDMFNARKASVQAAGIKFVRIGGNAPNKKLALTDMLAFDTAIDRVVSIGATPLMQMPMNLPTADIYQWVAHFKAKGIKFWGIGNEPDPSSNFINWYNGTLTENSNTYAQFVTKFIAIATEIKTQDPTAIIAGPDFRQFWGDAITSSSPFGSYYPAFISDVGARSVNGVPLLDIFAVHFYGYHNESTNKSRFDTIQSYIDNVNLNRSSKLIVAIGEVNATTSSSATTQPWGFDAGQFLVWMTKNLVAKSGAYVAPWSVYEGSGSRTYGSTDFSLFNTNGTRRSTVEHFAALALNRKNYYMLGRTNSSTYDNQIVQFGMTDATGSTVMIMNTNPDTTSLTYSARLDNSFSNNTANVNFAFASSNGNKVEWYGKINGKSSQMFTFDANGKRLSKWEYNKVISDSANTNVNATPLVTDLTLTSAVSGTKGSITLSAALPENSPRGKIEFYVDNLLKGSTSGATSLALDSTTIANGTHNLDVVAYDLDNNADAAPRINFSVANPVDISSQVSFLSSGLIYNRTTLTFNGTIKLSNLRNATISGPLQLVLNNLPAGVTLQNATGYTNGKPYITLSEIPASSSISSQLIFNNPAKVSLTYIPTLYSGSF